MKIASVSFRTMALLSVLGVAVLRAGAVQAQNNASGNNALSLNNASGGNASGNNALGFNNAAPANPAPLNNTGNAAMGNGTGAAGMNNAAPSTRNNAAMNGANSGALDVPSNAAPLNAVPSNGAATSAPDPALNTTSTNTMSSVAPPPPFAAAPASDSEALLTPAGQTAGGSGRLPATESEAPVADSEQDAYNTQIETKIRARLAGDLQHYCLDYCNILALDIQSSESFDTAGADLGFEGTQSNAGTSRRFSAAGARAEVMVDTRFGRTNIESLQKLFAKVVERYPLRLEVQWALVTFPETSVNVKSESQVRAEFAQSVRNQLERIVAEFCPRDCKIHNVDVNVARAGVDEVQNGSAYRYLFSRDGKGALYVRGVSATASINSLIDAERKDRVRSLMNETLLPFGSVNLQIKELPFPRAAEEFERDAQMARNDPWGLNRLGEALKVFREFANTKETIRETSSSNQSMAERSNSSESAKSLEALRSQTETEKNSSSNSEKSSEKSESERNKELQATNSELSKSDSNSSNSSSEANGLFSRENLLIIGAILIAALVACAFGLRYVVAGKRMQQVMNEGMIGMGSQPMMGQSAYHASGGMADGPQGGGMAMGGGHGHAGMVGLIGASAGGLAMSEDSRRNFSLQTLRDELVQIFVTQPKVARDVFGRMIREDGIASSSKLVVIFGEMMIFELLGDADMKKEIYTLAEYVHVNAPAVPVEEQLEILRALKLKMTAGKMRLMSSRTLDMFDFLKAKSARQIYEVICDESARSQAIVLTQISTEKRRAVFELFEGQAKVDLLRELSNNDVVQREYLFNVAEALKRKALTKPSFDGERVQGIDVLLDLLERAELEDQRNLMADLDRNSTEIARMLRTRLITVETLAYLRDGLLLEIFLSMESNTMATFLAGTREHVRNLILSKAPPDVADNWVEGLEQIRSIDAEALRLAEMQVIAKVRSFTNQGLLNLLDVNLSLYPKVEFEGDDEGGTNATAAKRVFRISNPLVA